MIDITGLKTVYEKVEHVPGWFSFEDAVALYNCIPEEGIVVEVGCFCGKSARFISSFIDVVCIDPLKSYNDHFLSCARRVTDSEIDNGDFECFFKQHAILDNENRHRIQLIKKCDFDVWSNWKYGKIGLLYIDHEHTENSVFESIVNWEKHLTKDAFVVVHDAMHKGVLSGIARSNIRVCKIVRESLYCPAVCKWSPMFL